MAYNPIPPLGQATMANSSPVVLASDHTAVPVSDVDTLAALSDLSSIVHAEGDTHVDGDSAVPSLAVRKDTPAPLAPDGAYHVLETDANGRLHVLDQNSAAALTALQLIDDAIHSGDAALSKYAVIGAVFDDAATATVTENQAQSLRMSSRRALLIEGVASGTAVAVSLASVPSHAVTNAGTFAVQETGSATRSVQGLAAHDAADTGNPVPIGGVAVIGGTSPTPVAAGDRTRTIYNQHGIPYVMAGHPNLITREYDFGATLQADLNLAAAAVASDERCYVTRLEVTVDNANTADVGFRCGFGQTAVPTASATGVSGMIASHPGLAAGSGSYSGNGSGIIAVGGLHEEPRFTSEAATSGNTHVVISYFIVDETS